MQSMGPEDALAFGQSGQKMTLTHFCPLLSLLFFFPFVFPKMKCGSGSAGGRAAVCRRFASNVVVRTCPGFPRHRGHEVAHGVWFQGVA